MKKFDIKKTAMDSAALIGGGVAAGYITKLVPIANVKIKAASPILVGMLLMNQKGVLATVGAGMVTAGGVNLAKSFGIGSSDDLDINGILDELEINGPGDVLNGPGDVLNGNDEMVD